MFDLEKFVWFSDQIDGAREEKLRMAHQLIDVFLGVLLATCRYSIEVGSFRGLITGFAYNSNKFKGFEHIMRDIFNISSGTISYYNNEITEISDLKINFYNNSYHLSFTIYFDDAPYPFVLKDLVIPVIRDNDFFYFDLSHLASD